MFAMICLVSIVAAASDDASTPEATRAVLAELEAQPPLSPHEIRQAMRAALRDEAISETSHEQRQAIIRLCALYAEMMLNSDFAQVERDKWRAKLGSRLRKVRRDLDKEWPAEPALGESSSTYAAGAAGGGATEARSARQLIDLITTTINPETWEVNGGKGSIFYFTNLRVLVVRHTQEVHEKLGGLLPSLR